jgi:hypothetical protein
MATTLFFFSRSRSQVSAPIELFVAVIIMSLSIALSFYIYSNFNEAYCEYQIRTNNDNLKDAMQKAAISYWGSSEPASYEMPRCGRAPVQAVRFVRYPDARYCKACPSSFKGCWRIEPLTYDAENGVFAPITDASVCVSLAEDLNIEAASEDECNAADSACPKGVDASQCASKSGYPANIYNNLILTGGADWVTFARGAQGYSSFRMRIEKRPSSGTASGAAGTLRVCANQTFA